MPKQLGCLMFDVPNTKQGQKFFTYLQKYLNRTWYGLNRRGRGVRKGKTTNHTNDVRVEDADRWAIYVSGSMPRKWCKENEVRHRLYKLNEKHTDLISSYDKKVTESKQAKVKLEKYKLRLFGWNISLWREERREGNI